VTISLHRALATAIDSRQNAIMKVTLAGAASSEKCPVEAMRDSAYALRECGDLSAAESLLNAAVTEAIDRVITFDTPIAHLGGAFEPVA